jgi:ribosomal-protein-serine acetyltransferase
MLERNIELTDGVVVLRPPTWNDVSGIFEAVRESIADLKPWMAWCDDGYSAEDTRVWVDMLPEQWREGMEYAFVITDAGDGTILGGCSLGHISRLYQMANLGYWVRSSRRGQGIAGRAAKLAARFGFKRLGLTRAEIVVAVENTASLRVAAKSGAQREGILRNRIVVREKIYDAVMHSLVPADLG